MLRYVCIILFDLRLLNIDYWSKSLVYLNDISMVECWTAVSPFLRHWRYCSLAPTHRHTVLHKDLPFQCGPKMTRVILVNAMPGDVVALIIRSRKCSEARGWCLECYDRSGIWLDLVSIVPKLPAKFRNDMSFKTKSLWFETNIDTLVWHEIKFM